MEGVHFACSNTYRCKTTSPWQEIKNIAKNAKKKFTAEEINSIALTTVVLKTSTTEMLISAISCGVSTIRSEKTEEFCRDLIQEANQKRTK